MKKILFLSALATGLLTMPAFAQSSTTTVTKNVDISVTDPAGTCSGAMSGSAALSVQVTTTRNADGSLQIAAEPSVTGSLTQTATQASFSVSNNASHLDTAIAPSGEAVLGTHLILSASNGTAAYQVNSMIFVNVAADGSVSVDLKHFNSVCK
jgi:hypothetical protein